MHGGALMAYADSLGGTTAHANLKPGQRTATIESKTNFFAGIPIGDVARATCVPLHRGRSTIVVETRITRRDGKLAAIVTQTQIVMEGEGIAPAGAPLHPPYPQCRGDEQAERDRPVRHRVTHLQFPAEPHESSSAGHGAFFANRSASARSEAAANTAHEPVRLMKEPTPPTHGSVHVVLSTSATPAT